MLIKFNDIEKLVDNICKLLNDKENIVIQAGHFPIICNNEGKLVPAINNDISDPDLVKFINNSPYISDFPLQTFKIALNLTDKKDNCTIKFAFIVNDWQWINKGIYNNYINDRAEFYYCNELPFSYNEIFSKHSYSNVDIIKSNHYIPNNIFWSEYKLRKIGQKSVLDCSPHSCAMEYLPFLDSINTCFDTLISFIPITCKEPILFASINFLKKHRKRLIHVFYNPLENYYILSYLDQTSIA